MTGLAPASRLACRSHAPSLRSGAATGGGPALTLGPNIESLSFTERIRAARQAVVISGHIADYADNQELCRHLKI